MKNAVTLSASLGLVCAIASGILAYAYNLTLEAQEKARTAEQFEAMQQLFPQAEFSTETDPTVVVDNDIEFKFYPARVDGTRQGTVAMGATTQGFGGRVDVMIGIEAGSGEIRKVLVTDHEETPGLGTQATDRQRKKSLWELFDDASVKINEASPFAPNAYLDQFDGKTAPENGGFEVVKSADALKSANHVLAVTGATITSRAVADAIARTMNAYQSDGRQRNIDSHRQPSTAAESNR